MKYLVVGVLSLSLIGCERIPAVVNNEKVETTFVDVPMDAIITVKHGSRIYVVYRCTHGVAMVEKE